MDFCIPKMDEVKRPSDTTYFQETFMPENDRYRYFWSWVARLRVACTQASDRNYTGVVAVRLRRGNEREETAPRSRHFSTDKQVQILRGPVARSDRFKNS